MDQIAQPRKHGNRISNIKEKIQALTIFITLLLPSIEVEAFGATTRGGYFGCFKKEWLKDMRRFKESEKENDFQPYLESKKCIVLKKGLEVSVSEFPGFMDNTVGFIYRGMRVWTTVDALDFTE